jgi:hypothetical protein
MHFPERLDAIASRSPTCRDAEPVPTRYTNSSRSMSSIAAPLARQFLRAVSNQCHPCEHVRFHNIAGTRKSIHCGPIYTINQKQPLAFISIPKVASLTLAKQTEDKDVICDWLEQITGRATFWIELGPPTPEKAFHANNLPLAAVSYDRWFTIFLSRCFRTGGKSTRAAR